jgi:hypothetical protein
MKLDLGILALVAACSIQETLAALMPRLNDYHALKDGLPPLISRSITLSPLITDSIIIERSQVASKRAFAEEWTGDQPPNHGNSIKEDQAKEKKDEESIGRSLSLGVGEEAEDAKHLKKRGLDQNLQNGGSSSSLPLQARSRNTNRYCGKSPCLDSDSVYGRRDLEDGQNISEDAQDLLAKREPAPWIYRGKNNPESFRNFYALKDKPVPSRAASLSLSVAPIRPPIIIPY